MRRQYRYFQLTNYGRRAGRYEVLRKDGEREEVFVATEGWRPSSPFERIGSVVREIDEEQARLVIDGDTSNRFMPLDRPFRYFALTDAEQPQAVVRRWTDEQGDLREDVLVSIREWAPGTAQDRHDGVPIDAAAVDRFAAILEERETGRNFYHYVAIVDEEHSAEDPLTVVRERPATGEAEVCTTDLVWEPGVVAGKRIPISVTHALRFKTETMVERVRRSRRYRYYAVVSDDHPDVTAPAALVRQNIRVHCLPSDEVYRQDGRWVKTNAVIAIRAGERPGAVVPITAEAAIELRTTWTPRPVLVREPVSSPLFHYCAVVSGTHPVDDPVTVVRVRDGVEEIYTPALRWERATAAGERVPISAVAALRFEETQFRRVFGGARFQYYVVVTLFHPDPDDPAAVVRGVTDDLGVTIKENHGPWQQWTCVPPFDERKLVPVAAERVVHLREVCDSRPATPLYYHRGWRNKRSQDVPDTLLRYWDELGVIHAQYFRNGGWHDTRATFSGHSISSSDDYLHPIDIAAVRRFEAQGHHAPPPPVREYAYHALFDYSGLKPAGLAGLLRTGKEGKRDSEEQFSAHDRSWSTSYVCEDVERGKKDFVIIGMSEAEAEQARETLVERWERDRAVVAAHTYYAITDAEHPVRDPLVLIRTWPTEYGERSRSTPAAPASGSGSRGPVGLRAMRSSSPSPPTSGSGDAPTSASGTIRTGIPRGPHEVHRAARRHPFDQESVDGRARPRRPRGGVRAGPRLGALRPAVPLLVRERPDHRATRTRPAAEAGTDGTAGGQGPRAHRTQGARHRGLQRRNPLLLRHRDRRAPVRRSAYRAAAAVDHRATNLVWESASVAGRRVRITGEDAEKFTHVQALRVCGDTTYRYYAITNPFEPDVDNPALVVRERIGGDGVTGEHYQGEWVVSGAIYSVRNGFANGRLTPIRPDTAARLTQSWTPRPECTRTPARSRGRQA